MDKQPSDATRRSSPTRSDRPRGDSRQGRNDRRGDRNASSSNRQRGDNRSEVDDRLAVLLRHDTAEELLDLIRDTEGDADEDLLDEAAVAMHAAVGGRLPQVPRGMLVLRVRPDERNGLLSLIKQEPTDERRTAKVGDRLAQLLQRASA